MHDCPERSQALDPPNHWQPWLYVDNAVVARNEVLRGRFQELPIQNQMSVFLLLLLLLLLVIVGASGRDSMLTIRLGLKFQSCRILNCSIYELMNYVNVL